MNGNVTTLREHRPTYMDGEVPGHLDVVRVDPLDRDRVGQVMHVERDRVFVRYDDFNQPTEHWCSVDRCELVRRR